MKIEVKSFKSMSLIGSILFLILGIVLFTNSSINFINYIVGGFLVLFGIIRFMMYSKSVEKSIFDLSSAIIPIVLGVIIVMFSTVFDFLLKLLMGGWIIYWGLKRLMETIKLSNEESTPKVKAALIVLCALMIGCGIYIIAVSNIALSMIGLFIAIYASIDIVSYIIKNTQK